tara:strand:- start:5168 stop:5503 length:336 start_codon:yes stop_codon:yes gene_type:complete
MKIFTFVYLLFVSPFLQAGIHPADQEVKDYVLQELPRAFYGFRAIAEDITLDENLRCFSAYSYRPEVGFCRVSGVHSKGHSTFLIIVKESKPGFIDSPLSIQVEETSRIDL